MTPEENEVFHSYYNAYLHDIIVYSYARLNNWHDAEVAAQETFRVDIQKWRDLMDSSDRLAWLKGVAKKQCSNMRRAAVRRANFQAVLEAMAAEAPPPDDPLLQIELMDKCERILTEKEMAVFRLVMMEGYTVEGAARRLHINGGAGRKRYERAVEKLRTHWNDED